MRLAKKERSAHEGSLLKTTALRLSEGQSVASQRESLDQSQCIILLPQHLNQSQRTLHKHGFRPFRGLLVTGLPDSMIVGCVLRASL